MVGSEDVCLCIEDAEVFVVGGEDAGWGGACSVGDYVDVVRDAVVEVWGYEAFYAGVGAACAAESIFAAEPACDCEAVRCFHSGDFDGTEEA